ncbi:MAG: pyridoxal phosphate-dependent aminotransferase [Propionibacteriaceae bacterium]|jgi:cystathionine beta-lyase|nr:pyridoxal phosphate-dependent aminotransferase [Propionibacteriaceae bacterium]
MYDFDTILNRRGTNSEKWNVAPGELPMWVADMDFRTAPEIIDAVTRKADSGVYGYTSVPPEFAKAIASWWYKRHAWEVDPAWVSYALGVVPAISSLIRTFTKSSGNVLVQTPVYNMFFNCIRNSGRKAVTNDLVYENGEFRIDWEDLEAKLADPKTSLFILCNPQNPTGQVWSREDLARMGQLAAANDVVVIADEIHCDLTTPGIRYIPFASIDETCANNAITLVSPTKAFNIPGLQTSAVIASNEDLRGQARQSLRRDDLNEPNAFAIEAAIAAFTKSQRWLDELRVYIHRNKEQLTDFLARNLPQLYVVPSQATYLPWVDFSAIVDDTTELTEFIRKETGLFINPGALYGDNGKAFVRINVACPSAVLQDGLYRLRTGIDAWVARAEETKREGAPEDASEGQAQQDTLLSVRGGRDERKPHIL